MSNFNRNTTIKIILTRSIVYYPAKSTMRKTNRKQKKLDKLRMQYSGKYSAKLDSFTAMKIPETTEIVINLYPPVAETRWTSDETVHLAKKDYGRFAKGLIENTTVKKINCPTRLLLVDYLCEALKINKAVETLRFTFTEQLYGDELVKFLNSIVDIITYSNLTNFLCLFNITTRSENDFDGFNNALKNNTTLTSFGIPMTNYFPKQLEGLVSAINHHPNLTSITVHPSIAGQYEMEMIGELIKANRITTLSLARDDPWCRQSLIPIFKALKENTSLTDLSLANIYRKYLRSAHDITKEDMEILGDALRHNQSLTKLDITGNNFRTDLVSVIFDSLQHNKTLTKLDFWNNNLDYSIQPTIAAFLNVNESLTELDLSHAKIRLDEIGLALKNNKSVTSLNLFLNYANGHPFKSFTEGLRFNKTLIKLSLKECGVDDQGCQYLGEAIKTNQCLLHLDISGQDIKVDGFKAMIEALRKNDSLTDLIMSRDKSVPFEMHEEILQLQNKNKRYRQDLIINTITILIQIARTDAFDMFPLEIWLRIFKHLVGGGIPGFNHIAESILMQCDVRDLAQLCKMKIVRINGKSHLVSKTNK